MTIDEQIAALIQREGGYVNHPADRGGPTKYGITEQVARAFGYSGGMRDLSIELARSIYRARYWKQPRLDEVFLVYPRVAEELFDTGVNMGTKTAGRFLQRAMNLLNRGASDYPDIVADGAIGAITIDALNRYRRKRGEAGEIVLMKALEVQQGARYLDLAEKDPSQEAFLNGWLDKRIGQPA